ncbi:MAG: hypothetical protein JWO50_451 [Candidatus Kaiserbacteria bacterium]|nr:hypothetical protein [Candidatus Kaiserbacteria bacterium]
MSNGNILERLWKLEATANKLVLDGKRTPESLCSLLQEFNVNRPEPPWREEHDIIYFSVTSDGTTGVKWIARLESKDFHVSDEAVRMLCSTDFKPTSGVTTKVAVFKGSLFGDRNRITSKIRSRAEACRFVKPNTELACLIREKFSDEEIAMMGLRLISVMHEHFKIYLPSGRYQLCVGHHNWLSVCESEREWYRNDGFAFAVP